MTNLIAEQYKSFLFAILVSTQASILINTNPNIAHDSYQYLIHCKMCLLLTKILFHIGKWLHASLSKFAGSCKCPLADRDMDRVNPISLLLHEYLEMKSYRM